MVDLAATLAERGRRYGKFVGHAVITQKIKDTMRTYEREYFAATEGVSWNRLAPDQREALEMIAHKIGKILNGDPDYSDSWHDIAGYAKSVADRLDGKVV